MWALDTHVCCMSDSKHGHPQTLIFYFMLLCIWLRLPQWNQTFMKAVLALCNKQGMCKYTTIKTGFNKKKKGTNNFLDCFCCNSLRKFKLHFQIFLHNVITATEVFLCKCQVVNNHLVKQVVKGGSIQQGRSLWHLLRAQAASQFTDAVPPNWRLSFSVAMPISEIKPDAGWEKTRTCV